jgi:hypothetical protein
MSQLNLKEQKTIKVFESNIGFTFYCFNENGDKVSFGTKASVNLVKSLCKMFGIEYNERWGCTGNITSDSITVYKPKSPKIEHYGSEKLTVIEE